MHNMFNLNDSPSQRFVLNSEKHLPEAQDRPEEAQRLKEHRKLPPFHDDLGAQFLRYRAPPVGRDEPLLRPRRGHLSGRGQRVRRGQY